MKIIVKNSPNHYTGRRGWKADMIAMHQSGCPQLSTALNYYINGNVCSPNWLIDTNGTIYQCVHPDNAAWCNGTRTTPGDKLYYGYALSKIVRDRQTNANYYTYSIEFVHCQQGNINEAQITAAVELIQQVIIPHMMINGVTPKIDREHVIGHSEITPKTRDPETYNCPGKKFPFDEIIRRVNGTDPAKSTEKLPTTTEKPTVKKCKFLYKAAVRSKPRADSAKLGEYKPGMTATIIVDSDKTDPVTGYVYVRISADTERWVVKTAIK